MSDKPKECPTCKSPDEVIPIVYGKPGNYLTKQLAIL